MVWSKQASKPVFQASIIFFFFSRDRVSLGSPGCPGTHSVDQAGFKKSTCLCLSSAGIKGLCHHCPAVALILNFFFFFLLSCSSGCHRDSPTFVSQVLGLKLCTMTPCWDSSFLSPEYRNQRLILLKTRSLAQAGFKCSM